MAQSDGHDGARSSGFGCEDEPAGSGSGSGSGSASGSGSGGRGGPRRAPRRRRLSLGLPHTAEAPHLARQATREALADVLPAGTLGDLLLIVNELVTNAVLHGSGAIELRLEADDQRVRGEVRDEGAGFEPGPGRSLGLFLVDRLTDRWGVATGRHPTRVWFEVPVIGLGDRALDG